MKNLKRVIGYIFLASIWTILMIMSLPLMLVFMPAYWILCPGSFTRAFRYRKFLRKMEGSCFFCYSNRKGEKEYVESHVLPLLSKDVKLIMINGRQPESEFDKELINEMICCLRDRKGFPYLIRIERAKVIDKSLNEEFRSLLASGQSPQGLQQKMEEFYTCSLDGSKAGLRLSVQ